jgi:hypothetical protein
MESGVLFICALDKTGRSHTSIGWHESPRRTTLFELWIHVSNGGRSMSFHRSVEGTSASNFSTLFEYASQTKALVMRPSARPTLVPSPRMWHASCPRSLRLAMIRQTRRLGVLAPCCIPSSLARNFIISHRTGNNFSNRRTHNAIAHQVTSWAHPCVHLRRVHEGFEIRIGKQVLYGDYCPENP